jgi:cell surface protein SprA
VLKVYLESKRNFVKQQLQVFSQNKISNKECCLKAAKQDFEMFALDYDNDRHFFYRNILTNMTALKNYPFVDSSSNYRIEVWVTNKR